jgi:hypothetical protein
MAVAILHGKQQCTGRNASDQPTARLIDAPQAARMIVGMKRLFLAGTRLLAIAAAALAITSCETTADRISKHPEIYQSLSPSDQALVSRGQIRPGMSKNAVWLAWGAPERKITGNMRGQPTETWIYITYRTPAYPYYGPYGPWAYPFGGGVAFIRTHHHGRSFIFVGSPFYDPFYYAYIPPSIPTPYKTVTFANGRVVSFQYLESPY